MKYRTHEIDLPDSDIYQNDALNRKPTVEFVEKFLAGLDGPFVLALDSPWGTGKTTMVRMLKSTLSAKGTPCIYFNAWQVDYASDPLVALVAAIDQISPKDSSAGKRFRNHMASVKRLTTSIAKHGAVAAAKAATFGALELDSAIEKVAADLTGALTKDLVDSFQKEKASLDQLRAELEKAITELSKDAEARPLVFFIDELDRCRPSFAIEMLERIKHLFDVDHLVFVLSVDKKQLEAATGAVYGEKIDSSEYLRRFFDMEFRLPQPESKRFASAQVKRFGLDDYFSERRRNHQTQHDGEHLIETIGELANIFQLSLRAIERAMARVALVCSQTPTNQFLDPILVAFLVVLRIKNSEVFDDLVTGRANPDHAMAYIRTLPGGDEFSESHLGIIIETYLLTGDGDEQRKNSKIAQIKNIADSTTETAEASHARKITQAMQYTPPNSFYRHRFSISSVANKVEMASSLNS
ncbi:MAG: hypothetical protein GXC94_17500 [Comamonadaceae bacterium]|jgi:hypothetical protein|nr:hypothetical protein [Comamonadaceae bacterium]